MLKYDSALRLTNELHYINGSNGSGGTQADNIGYGYDKAGNRKGKGSVLHNEHADQ